MASHSLTPVDPQPQPPAVTEARLPIKQSSRQVRHLAQAIQLEETGTAPLVRFTMLVATSAVLIFLLWSALTTIDEVATADGQVVPAGSLMSLQHLEGGIVESILVKEGELVDAGQPLIKMSPAAALGDLEQTRAREAALLLKAERLRAFAEGRQPDFSFIGPGYERLVADNKAIYQTQVQSGDTTRAVTLNQIEQKRSDAALLEEQRKTLEEQIATLSEQAKLRQDLLAQHLVTITTYLDTKRELARLKGELARTIGQGITAREALSETENRLMDQQSTMHKTTMDDLSTVIAELAQVQESIGRLEDRVNRLVVTAPARGYVKGLSVHNLGAVIQPGGPICELVPVDRDLRVDGKVSTRDVGHLKAGQRVKVKVGTYDFARYGAVWGVLEQVSASSFLDEKGAPYFKASISLEHDYVGKVPGRYGITPGMTVSAEIITGSKTLFQYMLKPIFTQVQESFHER